MNSGRVGDFRPATRELLEARALLRRVDSKFVLSTLRLDAFLEGLVDHYTVLRVPTGSVATYQSLYFDSPTLQLYHDHRRGRRVRHKVRIRHYPDREVSFLEVKTKRNETLTEKHRLPVPFLDERLGARELAFLRGHVGDLAGELGPALVIGYQRISLIGLEANERVTIDVDLAVGGGLTLAHPLDHLAVVEIKQSPFCPRSPAMRALVAAGLRERSLSKYVTALALSRPELRKNRLLPDLRALERIDARG